MTPDLTIAGAAPTPGAAPHPAVNFRTPSSNTFTEKASLANQVAADGVSTQPAIKQAEAPAADPNRPAWLPPGFNKPEELAAAYAEAVGKPAPKIDVNAMNEKFLAQGGKFTEEDYKAFEAFGLSPEHVQTFEYGLTAKREQYRSTVFEAAGGENTYKAAMQWAQTEVPPAEQAAFDAEVSSGDVNRARVAVQGLVARFKLKVGHDPKMLGGAAGPSGPKPFASTGELKAAMRDPRYDSTNRAFDAAYRAEVDQRVLITDALR